MKHFHVHECVICGKEFDAERITAKFCSHKCRQQAYRYREWEKKRLAREEKQQPASDSVTAKTDNVTENVGSISLKPDSVTPKTDSVTPKTDSVTENIGRVTHKPDSVIQTRCSENLASRMESRAERLKAYFGSTHQVKPVQQNETITEADMYASKRELKRCIRVLLSFHQKVIEGQQIRSLSDELRTAWLKAKQASFAVRWGYMKLMDNDVLPMLDRIILKVEGWDGLFRFGIEDSMNEDLKKMVNGL